MRSPIELKVGDIVYVPLEEQDGLTLRGGYRERRKYIVIVGFTAQGVAVGALLINSRIDRSKQSRELMDCQYPLRARIYPGVLGYDSWLDCSDIFEIPQRRIEAKGGVKVGRLHEEDFGRVMAFLRETDVFDNATKRRYGLL